MHSTSFLKKRFGPVAAVVLLAGSVALFSRTAYAAGEVAIDETNFPDVAFRQYVQTNFDTDSDGSLSEEEIGNITNIYYDGNSGNGSISTLKGVEHFRNLSVLYCDFCELETLDLSKNTALTALSVYGNHLTSLDLSNNDKLTYLGCSFNQLSSLDLSKNTALANLYCGNNQLTTLDISKNLSLSFLACEANHEMSTLNIGENTALTNLSCTATAITALDISKCTALTELWCSECKLGRLDVSNNTALTNLCCSGCGLNSLDVSSNTQLEQLECYANDLQTLDIRNNTNLKTLNCYDNHMASLDISACPHLIDLKRNGTRNTETEKCEYQMMVSGYPFYLIYDATTRLIGADNEPGVFPDVPENSWYAGVVKYVSSHGYMNGKKNSDGNVIFAPNDPLTRAEFATVLYNKENKPDVAYSNIFGDIPDGKWYTNPVLWAFEKNITKGYANSNLFGVSDNISREQMAQMFYAYAKMKGYNVNVEGVSLDRFADANRISNWAVTAIKWATANGVMNGSSDTVPKLNPAGKATRAECAAMIRNFTQKFESQPME